MKQPAYDRTARIDAAAGLRRRISELDRLVGICLERSARLAGIAAADREEALVENLALCLYRFCRYLDPLFEIAVREVDGERNLSQEWPRELLETVSSEQPGRRSAVLNTESHAALRGCMAFGRSFEQSYRHGIETERILVAFPDDGIDVDAGTC
jgi:hypothetical protein